MLAADSIFRLVRLADYRRENRRPLEVENYSDVMITFKRQLTVHTAVAIPLRARLDKPTGQQPNVLTFDCRSPTGNHDAFTTIITTVVITLLC